MRRLTRVVLMTGLRVATKTAGHRCHSRPPPLFVGVHLHGQGASWLLFNGPASHAEPLRSSGTEWRLHCSPRYQTSGHSCRVCGAHCLACKNFLHTVSGSKKLSTAWYEEVWTVLLTDTRKFGGIGLSYFVPLKSLILRASLTTAATKRIT